MRVNAGYTITDTIHVGEVELVLGEQANGKQFVTWECKSGDNYDWGHYFDSLAAAKRDLLSRAHEALGGKEPAKKPYFFCMTVCVRRTGAAIGRRVRGGHGRQPQAGGRACLGAVRWGYRL